jgi:hypothetical protein
MGRVVKKGKQSGIQRYQCKQCQKKFQNKRRKDSLKDKLLNQYIWQRQTLNDLANQYGRTPKWVQLKLDEVEVRSIVKLDPQPIIVVADTTFFSRGHGLTVFREPLLKKNVWWKEIIHEKADVYRLGRGHLEQSGFIIQAVILDGRRGIREVFKGIPVQMCHFHQRQIIKRYLTTRPKLLASKELKEIVSTLVATDERIFAEQLNEWHNKWKNFLKEKTTNPETGKWCYTHKRVRSAYRSLKTNLPFLFTYQRYPELNIPNTTNSLDGFFNRLKSLLNVHRGLNPKRRMRVVVGILKGKK